MDLLFFALLFKTPPRFPISLYHLYRRVITSHAETGKGSVFALLPYQQAAAARMLLLLW